MHDLIQLYLTFGANVFIWDEQGLVCSCSDHLIVCALECHEVHSSNLYHSGREPSDSLILTPNIHNSRMTQQMRLHDVSSSHYLPM